MAVKADEVGRLLALGTVLGRVSLPSGECFVTVHAVRGRGAHTRVRVTVAGVELEVPLGAVLEVRAG